MPIERCLIAGAPKPLGAYCHAVIWDERLILTAGLSARDPQTGQVPGLSLSASGQRLAYDIRLETRACLNNLKIVLEGAGGGLDSVLEIQVFLTDMKDFAAYNAVFSEFFEGHPPARTTVGVSALPGPLAIEIKAVAARKTVRGEFHDAK